MKPLEQKVAELSDREYAAKLADAIANCQVVCSLATSGFDVGQDDYRIIVESLREYAALRTAPEGMVPDPRIAKIEALRNLKPGWNSYDAEVINKATLDAALALCSAIPAEFSSIIPIADGGVMFGKNGDEVTLTVYSHEEPLSALPEGAAQPADVREPTAGV